MIYDTLINLETLKIKYNNKIKILNCKNYKNLINIDIDEHIKLLN